MGRSKNVEGNFVENSSVQISNREVKASVFTELLHDAGGRAVCGT